jgi:hypothetical protein
MKPMPVIQGQFRLPKISPMLGINFHHFPFVLQRVQVKVYQNNLSNFTDAGVIEMHTTIF